MRKLAQSICFLFCALIASSAIGQSAGTYVIAQQGNVKDLAPYTQALDQTDLTKYRKLDSRNTLSFANGLKVSVFSANELVLAGKIVDLDVVDEVKDRTLEFSTFSLHRETGIIIESVMLSPEMQKKQGTAR